jgi:hypothetical protein
MSPISSILLTCNIRAEERLRLISVVNMVNVFEDCTTEEQRSVVRSFVGEAKGVSEKDIHKDMFPVYGGKCLSSKAVHNWIRNSQMMPDRVAMLRLRQKQLCSG